MLDCPFRESAVKNNVDCVLDTLDEKPTHDELCAIGLFTRALIKNDNFGRLLAIYPDRQDHHVMFVTMTSYGCVITWWIDTLSYDRCSESCDIICKVGVTGHDIETGTLYREGVIRW